MRKVKKMNLWRRHGRLSKKTIERPPTPSDETESSGSEDTPSNNKQAKEEAAKDKSEKEPARPPISSAAEVEKDESLKKSAAKRAQPKHGRSSKNVNACPLVSNEKKSGEPSKKKAAKSAEPKHTRTSKKVIECPLISSEDDEDAEATRGPVAKRVAELNERAQKSRPPVEKLVSFDLFKTEKENTDARPARFSSNEIAGKFFSNF